MPPEWRTDSDPVTRTWANVPEGQILFDKDWRGRWSLSPMFIDNPGLRAKASKDFAARVLSYTDAQLAAERFYADYLAAKEPNQ
jgi:hypothetical protein